MSDLLPHLRIIKTLKVRAFLIMTGLASLLVRPGDQARLLCPFLVFFCMERDKKAPGAMAGLALNTCHLRCDLPGLTVTGDMAGQASGIFLCFRR